MSNVFVASAPLTVICAVEHHADRADVRRAAPIVAASVTLTRLTATAAPTPSVPASVAEPSAFALPSAFSEDESVNSAAARHRTARPAASAVAEAVCMFTEIAAATSTAEPPRVGGRRLRRRARAGRGAAVRARGLLAKPSWLFDCAFVSPASFVFLSFAPDADAVDSASVADEPWAAKVTAPPAVRLRRRRRGDEMVRDRRGRARRRCRRSSPLAAPVALRRHRRGLRRRRGDRAGDRQRRACADRGRGGDVRERDRNVGGERDAAGGAVRRFRVHRVGRGRGKREVVGAREDACDGGVGRVVDDVQRRRRRRRRACCRWRRRSSAAPSRSSRRSRRR